MQENVGKIKVTYTLTDVALGGVEFVVTETITPWKDPNISVEQIYFNLTASTKKYHNPNLKIKRIEILEPTPHG